jgi:hypothetical protein
MAANKEEQKPQKASKYYPSEDVAVQKKVCHDAARMHRGGDDDGIVDACLL